MVFGDLLNGTGDRTRNVHSRPLRVRAGAALAPAQAHAAGQLLREDVDLPLDLLHAAGIIERVGFLQFLSHFIEPALVVPLGLRIEQLAGIAETSRGLRGRVRLCFPRLLPVTATALMRSIAWNSWPG